MTKIVAFTSTLYYVTVGYWPNLAMSDIEKKCSGGAFMRPSCRPFLCIGHLDNKASGEDVLFFKSIKMIDHADEGEYTAI